MAALTAVLAAPAADACTVEGSRMAAEAREKARLDRRKVHGTYQVLSVTRQIVDGFDGPQETATYFGKITTRHGKAILTEHTDDGFIILCSVRFTPFGDADGSFYLGRRKIDGTDRYQLWDWNGDYLPSDDEAVATDAERAR